MTIEELINYINEYIDSDAWKYEGCYLCKDDLELIVEALKQKRESKVGHWIYNSEFSPRVDFKCSCCETHWEYPFNYCPHCGSMMESEGAT